MTPTPEQIEAVARAICRADGYDPNSLNGGEYQWLFYEKEAVASIAAARPFIRAQALEEAAKEAECTPHQFKIVGAPPGSMEMVDSHKSIAAAIRGLKDV